MRRQLLMAAALALLPATAIAQDKPDSLNIGIATFLTGPASVFGVPARDAAEIIVERINDEGGLDGVPISLTYIDEGAGGESMMAEYRRLAEDQGVEIFFAAVSSGSCGAIAPVAEDLEVLNILWDCGTQRIFEENDYKYVYRTQANATPEMLGALLYLLKTTPDFSTIAVVNQDYAWGRDSWDIFSTALKAMKPDVEVVGEFFPAFGAPDFSTEISRLQALRPDVILSTSWGGDLDTFVRQAAQRGLMNSTTFLLPLGESSLERLGSALPQGVLIGARGDHYFMHPERRDDPEFQEFVETFHERTGAYPIYPAFHMYQAFEAFLAAHSKAIEAGGGEWPSKDQLVEAMEGLTFQGLGRELTIREDNQAIEAQLFGTTVMTDEHPFAVLENMMIFDGEDMTTPVGEESIEWVGSLTPDYVDQVDVATYDR